MISVPSWAAAWASRHSTYKSCSCHLAASSSFVMLSNCCCVSFKRLGCLGDRGLLGFPPVLLFCGLLGEEGPVDLTSLHSSAILSDVIETTRKVVLCKLCELLLLNYDERTDDTLSVLAHICLKKQHIVCINNNILFTIVCKQRIVVNMYVICIGYCICIRNREICVNNCFWSEACGI